MKNENRLTIMGTANFVFTRHIALTVAGIFSLFKFKLLD
ncbi:hypothetical protein Xedl_02305 [Xenorhabdus eapokensis]|uniref:Uncharacterized protein n=1 Tax=Xenorhabdus eapokensis TaxID=1873482 RepID=A0A1Q5TR02_9GAMM|nr:hypothetical protein Xedl_02305 [Xenorhabdus eapokensis]